MNQFSCVSDWLGDENGEFAIPVPPGTYRLHLEPINAEFTGGSSVGMWAETPTSKSFVNPIPPSDPLHGIIITAGETKDLGDIVAE